MAIQTELESINTKLSCVIKKDNGDFTPGDSGIVILGVDSDNNYQPLAFDSNNNLRVTLDAQTITVEVNLDLENDEVMIGLTPDNGVTRNLARGSLSGVLTTSDGFLNNLGYAQYLSTPPVLNDTEFHNLTLTQDGRLRVETPPISVNINLDLDLVDDEVMIGVTPDDGTTRFLVKGSTVGTVTSPNGFLNNIGYGQYLSTPPTLNNGDLNNFTITDDARLRVDASFSPNPISASAVTVFRTITLSNVSESVFTGGGNVYGWNFYNPGTQPVFIRLLEGTTIILALHVPQKGSIFAINEFPIYFTDLSITCVRGYQNGNNTPPDDAIYGNIFYK